MRFREISTGKIFYFQEILKVRDEKIVVFYEFSDKHSWKRVKHTMEINEFKEKYDVIETMEITWRWELYKTCDFLLRIVLILTVMVVGFIVVNAGYPFAFYVLFIGAPVFGASLITDGIYYYQKRETEEIKTKGETK